VLWVRAACVGFNEAEPNPVMAVMAGGMILHCVYVTAECAEYARLMWMQVGGPAYVDL